MEKEKIKLTPSQIVDEAELEVEEQFRQIDKICEFNQKKVLDAFIKNRIGEEHFYTVTGYGHDDMGREALDKVYADVFKAQKAIVRPHFVSGTHALACCFFGVLRFQDTLISAAGAPYDTLETVIGHKSKTCESLWGHGVDYLEIPLIKGLEVDMGEIMRRVNNNTKMVLIQRSRGYSLRRPLTVDKIARIVEVVKSKNPDCICFVDNCYGEFIEENEPIEAGADLVAGSLIKNAGGGIVEAGGYIAGRADLVDLCAARLTAPGIKGEGGAMFNQTRTILQGFFMAPSVVAQAYKGAILAAKTFEMCNLRTSPHANEKRGDLIQAVIFNNKDKQIAFCKALQKFSPVDSHLTPIPDNVAGYDDKLIMAGGTFIEGSTIELSADGPMREPYVAYMQGGLNYAHVKIALKGILSEILD